MASLPIGITADDLTGAADTAAALARPGQPVTLWLKDRPQQQAGRAAFALTTDSRACEDNEAYQRVRESIVALRAAGASMIYKKLDSNLRGRIGAELAAVRDEIEGPVYFTPAFPARGRTVVEGVACIHGAPVADTEMGSDPEAPVTHSRIWELIHSQRDDLMVSSCPLSVVRSGASAIRSTLPGEGVIVFDAEKDSDLDTIAEAALTQDRMPALAGSAGLAAALGRRLLGLASRPTFRGEGRGRLLAILASSSQVLLSQVEVVARSDKGRVIPFICQMLERERELLVELQRAIAAVLAEFAAGGNVLIYASGELPRVKRPVEAVVEQLAHLAYVVIVKTKPEGLIVGGGATAQAVLECLGIEKIEIDDEPAPGIAAGIAFGRHFNGIIALKPGAAGDEHIIVRLLDYLATRVNVIEGIK